MDRTGALFYSMRNLEAVVVIENMQGGKFF
jgi:hypothetical protein